MCIKTTWQHEICEDLVKFYQKKKKKIRERKTCIRLKKGINQTVSNGDNLHKNIKYQTLFSGTEKKKKKKKKKKNYFKMPSADFF